MKKAVERRTYQETYFIAFVVCIAITIILDYFNVSVKESTEYATNIVKKTIENVNEFVLWFFPTALMVKKLINEWITSYFAHKEQIEKIKVGKVEEE